VVFCCRIQDNITWLGLRNCNFGGENSRDILKNFGQSQRKMPNRNRWTPPSVAMSELLRKLEHTEWKQVEANLRDHITELEKKVEEQNIDREQIDATLRDRITELEEELKERDREG